MNLFKTGSLVEDALLDAPNPKPSASDKSRFGKIASIYTAFSREFAEFSLDLCIASGCRTIVDPFSGMGTLAEAARSRPVNLKFSDISPFAILSGALRAASQAKIEASIALLESLVDQVNAKDEPEFYSCLIGLIFNTNDASIDSILTNPLRQRNVEASLMMYLSALSRIHLHKSFTGSNPTWVRSPDEAAIEGATGIGKSALLTQLSGSVQGESGHALAVINAAQRPSEELVVASIYQQLFKIDSAPSDLYDKAVARFRADLPGAVRKVFVALLADGLQLVTDKAENTIGALGEIVGGDGASSHISDKLLELDGDSRRYFIREFLSAIAGGAVIAIDNFDSADNSLVGFIRFLIKERPPRIRILLAHNSEVDDNSKWDNVVADLRAGGGKLIQLRSLDQFAVSSWFQDVFGRNPTSSELDEILAETHGRPYSIDLAFCALRGGSPGGVKSDYSGYYERSRRRLSKDARAVAELLTLLSRDTLIDSDLLAYAAEFLNVDSLSSALDELIDQRLLRREDNYLGLTHSLAQETLQQTITQPRRTQLRQAWYTAVRQLPVVELASASTVGLLPAIVDPLCDNRSPSDVVQIGTRLIESGQVRSGLEFVDRTWRITDTETVKADDVFKYAMLAAQTRLDFGRYTEVDGPLACAELMAGSADSKLAQVEILRMKLALRRNAYSDLSPLEESIRGRVLDDVRLQVECELVLNAALRDLMDLGGLSTSRDRLLTLREQSDLDQQNSIDRALARSSAKLGDSDSALAFASSALQSSNALSSIRAVGNANLAFGEASRYRQDYTSAMEGYANAVAIARATGNRDSLLWSLLGIVAGCIEQDDDAAATGPLEELDALLGEPGYEHPLETAHTALLHSLQVSSEEIGTNALQLYKQIGVVWPEQYLLDFFKNGSPIRTILL